MLSIKLDKSTCKYLEIKIDIKTILIFKKYKGIISVKFRLTLSLFNDEYNKEKLFGK